MSHVWTAIASTGVRRTEGSQAPAGRPVLGCELLHRCGTHRIAERWMARDLATDQPRLVYRVPAPAPHEPHALLESVRVPRSAGTPHLAGVIDTAPDDRGGLWISAEFVGNSDGPLTIPRVLASRPGGQMKTCEARRVVLQTGDALIRAHELGAPHGPARPDELMLDRLGHIRLELPGVVRLLAASAASIAAADSEVHPVSSLGRLMYRLVTGAEPANWASPTPAHQFAPGITRAWRLWLQATLAPAPEFADVRECLSACPGPSGR